MKNIFVLCALFMGMSFSTIFAHGGDEESQKSPCPCSAKPRRQLAGMLAAMDLLHERQSHLDGKDIFMWSLWGLKKGPKICTQDEYTDRRRRFLVLIERNCGPLPKPKS